MMEKNRISLQVKSEIEKLYESVEKMQEKARQIDAKRSNKQQTERVDIAHTIKKNK